MSDMLVDLTWTFGPDDPRPDRTFTVPLELGALVQELRNERDELRATVKAVRDLATNPERWELGKPMAENYFGPEFVDSFGYAMRDVLEVLDTPS